MIKKFGNFINENKEMSKVNLTIGEIMDVLRESPILSLSKDDYDSIKKDLLDKSNKKCNHNWMPTGLTGEYYCGKCGEYDTFWQD